MPVGLPPLGGPLGRTRGRLSASSLTTYLRCQRQWLLGYVAGLRGPLRPSQIIGIVVEDALCKVLMNHPPLLDSKEELMSWVAPLVTTEAEAAYAEGQTSWDEALWTQDGTSWGDVSVNSLEDLIGRGVALFLEEVTACRSKGGGPHLELFRAGEDVFDVPAPCWGRPPTFPRPEKMPSLGVTAWATVGKPTWRPQGEKVTWSEAWEIARPWFKDPRVHQPQRLYHPDGWAAGELDLVLRWDGEHRLVDIKSGTPDGSFAVSLVDQLEFYAWLWAATHEEQQVAGLEGWYLGNGERTLFEAPDADQLQLLGQRYRSVHDSMMSTDATVVSFPASDDEACDGSSAGCRFCSVTVNDQEALRAMGIADLVDSNDNVAPTMRLNQVQGRVNVRGRCTGAWGPMPNHFGEHVRGMVLVAGDKHIVMEESEPDAFPELHDHLERPVVIRNALPGVWRDQARLYLDDQTLVEPMDDQTDLDGITRLGLLRSRINVSGRILGIQRRSGRRLDGKPWALVSFVVWDRSHIAEVVAFGSSITGQILKMCPGDNVTLTGAEIGWRGGVLQLRIDNRKTRVEHRPAVGQTSDGES